MKKSMFITVYTFDRGTNHTFFLKIVFWRPDYCTFYYSSSIGQRYANLLSAGALVAYKLVA